MVKYKKVMHAGILKNIRFHSGVTEKEKGQILRALRLKLTGLEKFPVYKSLPFKYRILANYFKSKNEPGLMKYYAKLAVFGYLKNETSRNNALAVLREFNITDSEIRGKLK
ncbi:MAG: hypothetical protein V1676_00475 [Candidatus Diapherotrites archaeon]